MIGGFAALLRDGVNDGVSLFLAPSADDDLCALGGEKPCYSNADSAGGAGDNRYFSF